MEQQPFKTKSGRILTDEDFERLADEAERGYDVEEILKRRKENATTRLESSEGES